MKDKFLLRSIILIILLTTAGTIHAQITGSGTANYIPKFSGTSTIGNSIIYQKTITGFTSSDTYIGIGTTNPSAQLHVNGSIKLSGKIDGSRTSEYLGIYANGGVNYGAGIELSPDGLTAKEGTLSLYAGKGNGTPGGIKFYNYTTTYSLKCNMQINNKGNVGIGLLTIAPAYRLDIKDSINDTLVARIVNCHANGKGLLVKAGNNTATNNVLELQNNDGNSIFKVQSNGVSVFNGNVGVGTNNPAAKLDINAVSSTGLNITTQQSEDNGYCILASVDREHTKAIAISKGGTENFIVYGNGNVGIGTNNVTDQLHIHKDIQTSASTVGIRISSNEFPWFIGLNHPISDNNLIFANGNDKDNPSMVLTTGGNLGIGTTAPGDYKLAVTGKIHCTEVVVEALSSWPDYVFEKGYKLMPVKELEQYVTANKHLPGIPDTQTVSEKGVSVGEMNAQLLKKVEELTMYVIQLNKEIEMLKAQNAKR